MTYRQMVTLIQILLFLILSPVAASQEGGDKDQPETNYRESTFQGLKFRSIGPALTSGRIGDLAVHPENNGTYYAAVSSGGVWKTVNSGTTWTPVFDSQGSYSIGCITMDPGNPQVLWVGSGENNSQRSVGYGDGVYKSVDGGKTWKNMGLQESEHIGMIWIDPRDSQRVFVASQGPLPPAVYEKCDAINRIKLCRSIHDLVDAVQDDITSGVLLNGV